MIYNDRVLLQLDEYDPERLTWPSLEILRGTDCHQVGHRTCGIMDHLSANGEVSSRRQVWMNELREMRQVRGRLKYYFLPLALSFRQVTRNPSPEDAYRLLTFPKAWFVAAFLPLPPRPAVINANGKDVPRQTQILEDLEQQLGAVDEARYENARWWRNINRVMSGFGVLIIVAIIALVAVAATT